jgi:NAD(P)-dependent dehydrogenase (short-subunit alcohol dehydrogenase family)
MAPSAQVKRWATAALVFGILGLTDFWVPFGGVFTNALAVALAIVGLKKSNSGVYGGHGRAVAGLVLGGIGLIPAFIFMALFFTVAAAAVGRPAASWLLDCRHRWAILATVQSKVALVTGAGRGIGRAVARRLSAEGLRVALVGRTEAELAATAGQCAGPTLPVVADVTDPAALDAAFRAVEAAWGDVGVLVAAAGAGFSARLERTGDDDWHHMLELNLTAPFRCLRRAVPAMRANGFGRIVVIASNAAQVGEPYVAAYTASKHGVLGLVRSAAAELARDGITVNAVCPGFVDTPMTEQTVANIAAVSGRTPRQAREALASRQPIGRLITPDEVASATWFCIENAGLSGQAVTVDGGAVQS